MKSLHALIATWQTFVTDTDHPQPPPYTGADIKINRLIEDSRAVQPGDCFVARVRPYSDGHPFIKKAVENGAVLLIVQQPPPADLPPHVAVWHVPDSAVAQSWLAAAWHDFPGQHLTVIGITGTDGKTSVTNILYDILTAAHLQTGMISTIKAIIGNHEEPTGLHVTTPQAPEIQALLRRMVDDGVTHCILEITSMGLAEHRADAALFDIGVITNITHEHLDYHGGYDGYLAAKGRLFELAEYAVLNVDDDSYPYLATRNPYHITYGQDNPAQLTCQPHAFLDGARRDYDMPVQFAVNGTLPDDVALFEFMPEALQEEIETETETPTPFGFSFALPLPLIGRFNEYNVLAAWGAAVLLGIPIEAFVAAVSNLQTISGRMEVIDAGQPFRVIVDFAHTPNALEKAIAAAREICVGRVITVFGSAGRRDVAKRRMMAEVSAVAADVTIVTAEDPRGEPLDDILQMMADGATSQNAIENETFWRIPDRGRAIYHALTIAQPDDLILICGKGHEQSMAFAGVEYPWDDRTATKQIIAAWSAGRPCPDLGLPTF